MKFLDRFWHKALGRPYRLAKVLDIGSGPPVVLLHGIGRTGRVWEYVVGLLGQDRFSPSLRIIALDLLGFGSSPKPDWPEYSADDHAKAVIATLDKLKLRQPAVLVGHSMGCLVAVRVARLRPDLAKHLVLYEMPLYEGLPEKRRYRLRTNLYFRLYKRITELTPGFSEEQARLADRLANKVAGLEVTPETWQPFVKSLQNTIMKQTAADDIKNLTVAMDAIYGSWDMLVIRGKPKQFFGSDSSHITAHTIRTRHIISLKASTFIVSRIHAALQEPVVG